MGSVMPSRIWRSCSCHGLKRPLFSLHGHHLSLYDAFGLIGNTFRSLTGKRQYFSRERSR
jgi:hypothetical protein